MAEKNETTQITLPQINAQFQAAQNIQEQIFIIPLSGQWMPSVDPLMIGDNFITMTNLRYSDAHVESILGMTRINSTALTTYLKVRNSFLFLNEQSSENHLLVQAYNSGLSASQVLENTTAIPTIPGNFSSTALWTDSAGAGFGMFSNAPNSNVVYCNGVDSCIWGGLESYCNAFIMSDATLTTAASTITNARDYTEKINNTKRDSDNVVQIGGGNDSYTVLLINADEVDGTNGEDILDSSATPHTITAVNHAHVDTNYSRVGTGSVVFDGVDDKLTIPDHADFNFGTAAWTIDFGLRTTEGSVWVCGQSDDKDNYWRLTYSGISPSLSTTSFQLYTEIATVTKTVTITLPRGYFGVWQHLEIGYDGANFYGFREGVLGTTVDANNLSTMPNFSADLTIGCASGWDGETEIVEYADCNIANFRISKGKCRHTSSFSPPIAPYRAGSLFYLVATTRPAKGAKIYVNYGNQDAGTTSVKEFSGSSWSALSITDGTLDTATSTKSLNKTGTISWASTVDSSKKRYLEGYLLYWYLFELSAGAAEVYHITMDVPFQNIVNVWDGYYKSIASCYLQKAAQSDVTVNVTEFSTVEADPLTYANISSMTAGTHYIEVGLTSKVTGLFAAIPDAHTNSATSDVIISYWNGAAYVSVGAVVDGTAVGGKFFAKSGIITWSNNAIGDEVKKTISGGYPLYYYKISWTVTTDDSCRLYYLGGIPLTDEIKGYSFSTLAADRTMLGCNTYSKLNTLITSAQDQADVFNGFDSYDIAFGDSAKLTNAAAIFAQYASNIYNIVLVFKRVETWILVWNQTSTGTTWSRFRISPNVGLPAPRTLCVASVTFEKNINQSKVVGLWRSHDGIYLSNGQAPFCVSKDIEFVFNQSSTTHVNLAMIEKESSFFDKQKAEYHWLFASNDNTTLDKEYVLDTKGWKWFEIDRSTGGHLQCGVSVVDTTGNNYTYGFLDTGYMERLEYGNDFDGTNITSTLMLGSVLPVKGNFSIYTEILKANVISVSKNTDSNLTLTHYIDEAITGISYTLSMSDLTHRTANDICDIYSAPGIFHGFKLVAASGHETKAFEPLYFAIQYQPVREHLK